MVNKVHNKKKTMVCALLALAAVLGLFLGLYFGLLPETAQGEKTISVQLALKDSDRTVRITTDAEMLGEALMEEGLIEGQEGPYGLYILSADGYTADESAQEWWCVTKSGEQVNTGVDMTPIYDGDAFELTLMTGW